MAEFTGEDWSEARLTKINLARAELSQIDFVGAKVRRSNLDRVVMRAVSVDGAELDAPWLYDGTLIVNDVDVVPLVEAELNRRFIGRAERRAEDPEALRAAWAALETAWAGVLARVETMPAGTVEESVAKEWTFSQTLRHLIVATDMWLGKAVLDREQPFHPLGLLDTASAQEHDLSVYATETPSYAEVLAARADRQTMVRDFLAGVTTEELATERPNPHAPDYAETVRSCLHTILEEEWEHQRYAVRDLDQLAKRAAAETP